MFKLRHSLIIKIFSFQQQLSMSISESKLCVEQLWTLVHSTGFDGSLIKSHVAKLTNSKQSYIVSLAQKILSECDKTPSSCDQYKELFSSVRQLKVKKPIVVSCGSGGSDGGIYPVVASVAIFITNSITCYQVIVNIEFVIMITNQREGLVLDIAINITYFCHISIAFLNLYYCFIHFPFLVHILPCCLYFMRNLPFQCCSSLRQVILRCTENKYHLRIALS